MLGTDGSLWVDDMPTKPRTAGGNRVDGQLLAQAIRDAMTRRPGAYFVAVLEAVHAMPDQGVSGVFRFGESYGVLRGVLGALNIPIVDVAPAVWKRHHGLLKTEKDAARALAIRKWPAADADLKRKKDIGRADALLIAAFGVDTEAWVTQPELVS